MAEHNRKQNEQGGSRKEQDQSTGNHQQTTQTGAQNSGGTNPKEDDRYTEDLRHSGNRTSGNRNKGS